MNNNPHVDTSRIELTIPLEIDCYDMAKLNRGRELYKEYFIDGESYIVTVIRDEVGDSDDDCDASFN